VFRAGSQRVASILIADITDHHRPTPRNAMLHITDLAATAIASACHAQHLPGEGGVRIMPRPSDGAATSIGSLVVHFVERPQPTDTVVCEREANVFLADGVDRVVAGRVLDIDGGVTPPQLVLRLPRVRPR
jgi:hypothetical protein